MNAFWFLKYEGPVQCSVFSIPQEWIFITIPHYSLICSVSRNHMFFFLNIFFKLFQKLSHCLLFLLNNPLWLKRLLLPETETHTLSLSLWANFTSFFHSDWVLFISFFVLHWAFLSLGFSAKDKFCCFLRHSDLFLYCSMCLLF